MSRSSDGITVLILKQNNNMSGSRISLSINLKSIIQNLETKYNLVETNSQLTDNYLTKEKGWLN